jgi:hypothetical protein
MDMNNLSHSKWNCKYQCVKYVVYGETIMKGIVETKKKYIIQRYYGNRVHKKSLFSVEIYPGIVAEFGEPKSKLGSKKYNLTKLSFLKERYSKEMVESFWSDFHVKYIPYKYNGKKVAPIYKVVGNSHHLIQGGYIIICKNTSRVRATIKEQNGYDFWKEKFYDEGKLSSDKETINAAIPLLIDKIKNSTSVLKEMPYWDHRIFEELVAEIFKEFGYSVELTKKTRDGGKDIIALKKRDGLVEEKILIECKHWEDKVDVKPVRSLIGVAISQEELPTGIILATTSHFTKDAEEIVINSAIKIELERRDYEDILEWIQEYDAIQLSKEEVNAYFDCLNIV